MKKTLSSIEFSGEIYGIKPLSAYDYLKCELMGKDLLEKLLEQDFNKKICENLSEAACVVARCFFTSDCVRVFEDGLAVIENLTPSEIKKIYDIAKIEK